MQTIIAPSILTADFTRLGDQLNEAIDAGAQYIHLDVMDGHFVPNLTFGPVVVSALRDLASSRQVKLDAHLMIEKPENYIAEFARAGADILTVHIETCPHLHRTIQVIKSLGMQAGVTLNPSTPLGALEEILPDVDQVLVMTVNPGFGGQKFIPQCLDKIAHLRSMLSERGLSGVLVEVDGGLNPGNVAKVVQAGANILVIGSAIFNQQMSVRENMAVLWRALE